MALPPCYLKIFENINVAHEAAWEGATPPRIHFHVNHSFSTVRKENFFSRFQFVKLFLLYNPVSTYWNAFHTRKMTTVLGSIGSIDEGARAHAVVMPTAMFATAGDWSKEHTDGGMLFVVPRRDLFTRARQEDNRSTYSIWAEYKVVEPCATVRLLHQTR